MATDTQDLIMETFDHMLERMPFDKITVTALIKECNIGRNTFYYHYKDIYDLLDDSLTRWLGHYSEVKDDDTWQGTLKSILYACRAQKKKIYHVFNSLSRDQLVRYVFARTDKAISDTIEKFVEEKPVNPERVKTVSNIITYSVSGYFMSFLWNDMTDDIEKSIDELGIIFNELLDNLT